MADDSPNSLEPRAEASESARQMGRDQERQAPPELVRVLRLVEYVGPRDAVQDQVLHSLHGTRIGAKTVKITAVTISMFPEKVLESAAQESYRKAMIYREQMGMGPDYDASGRRSK